MPSLDKISVRNEVSQLKADFETLCSDGKIAGEIKTLMHSMLLMMELMLTIFLEKQTKKNSTNSSLPPSQTDEDESSLDQEGRNGKGKKENNTVADNSTVSDFVVRFIMRGLW